MRNRESIIFNSMLRETHNVMTAMSVNLWEVSWDLCQVLLKWSGLCFLLKSSFGKHQVGLGQVASMHRGQHPWPGKGSLGWLRAPEWARSPAWGSRWQQQCPGGSRAQRKPEWAAWCCPWGPAYLPLYWDMEPSLKPIDFGIEYPRKFHWSTSHF